ncbi:MAG: BrnT family toxin [Pyrinomonadaceae bacterium]
MITWDEEKREKVIKDHGIDFARIKDLFDDPFPLDYADLDHSFEEERRVIVGKTAVYGLVLIVYVIRGDDIRLITARRAERWLTRIYEKQNQRY